MTSKTSTLLFVTIVLIAVATKGENAPSDKVEVAISKKNSGNYEGAIRDFSKAIEEYESSMRMVYYNRAECQFKLGKFAEAEADFRKSIPYASHGMAENAIGVCLLKQKKYEDAKVMLDEALSKITDPEYSSLAFQYKLNLVLYYLCVDQVEDAKNVLEVIKLEHPNEDMSVIRNFYNDFINALEQ